MIRRVYIAKDEWYPVYDINDGWGNSFELEESLIARWEAAKKEFYEVQKLIKEAMHDGD